MFSRLRSSRRLRWGVGVGAAVLLLIVAAVIFLLTREQGNVSNPRVPFQAAPAPPPPKPKRQTADFTWPFYGYDKARTHVFAVAPPFRPPFKVRWVLRGRQLIEFTPVLGGRSLFLLKNNAALYALSRRTGRVRWKRHLGNLAASSPAYAHGTLYVTTLQRAPGVNAGRIVAVSAKDGHTKWSMPLPSRSESSPLVDKGTVFFGSENGTVYALRARDGFVRWRYHAGGAVKAGLALDGHGRLFFGDYSGHVQAIRESNGSLIWRRGTSGGAFGFSSGNFYATPAVAYGRVYLGNTDGNVYSYATLDGALAWRTHTGNYVYSSAAVGQVGGTPPTVYVGSYDGTMYAIDARSGRIRWSRGVQGQISGGVQVLGDLVFYSTLNHYTGALGAGTGKTIWTVHKGAFNPVVTDGRFIFLNGYTNLYAFSTGRSEKAAKSSVRRGHRRAARRKHAHHRRRHR
ncbi:MAG TPA: PQQ-binding-like beta-propeller repeat protein [Solirubrobacteraceae bacterium]|nr:PQQ-binding-like beta-propeller repeat protein [Solirubrobacteraceae bacterium]